MAAHQKLKAEAEALLKQAEAARRAETTSVVAEIQARMKEYGITLDDLKGGAKQGKARGGVAKYYTQTPATHGRAVGGCRNGWRQRWPRASRGKAFLIK